MKIIFIPVSNSDDWMASWARRRTQWRRHTSLFSSLSSLYQVLHTREHARKDARSRKLNRCSSTKSGRFEGDTVLPEEGKRFCNCWTWWYSAILFPPNDAPGNEASEGTAPLEPMEATGIGEPELWCLLGDPGGVIEFVEVGKAASLDVTKDIPLFVCGFG